MIRSMTGYGRGEYENGGRKYVVEIKTVNHRYADIFVKVPRQISFIEDRVRQTVSKNLSRGKIDVYVNYESNEEDSKLVVIDDTLAESYINAVRLLKDKFDLQDDISTSLVSRFPDVLKVEKAEEDADVIWEGLKFALDEAIDYVIKMRENEGEGLKKDFLKKAAYVESLVGEISNRAPEVVKDYKQRLETRIKELLEQSKMDEGLKARKIDILQFQINEIEAAQIRPGEEEELSAQRDLYRNAEKIAVAISGAREQLLGGDGSAGALELLSDAVSQVNFAGQYVESMAELGKKLESLMYDLEEYSGELRDFFSQLDFEPDDLEQVEERLDLIRRLKSKYGGSEQAVLDYLEQAKKELEEIELSDVRIEQLNGELKRAESMVNELAKKLSDERRKAAKKFEQNVNEQLNYLDMPNVRFSVDIRPIEPGPNGIDRVEFLIAPNPGEPPKPIARIASGGELSRIMLALKSVMADADDIDTLIFDEIDSGISGMAASKIGIKLREISEKRQVICVTHLAQISAQARNHFLIVKNVRGGRTYTDVLPLDYQGRVKELARIIGGVISEAALQTAREMLSNAGWN